MSEIPVVWKHWWSPSDPDAGFPPKPTAPPRPTTTKDPIASFCAGRPDGLYVNAADKTTYLQCFNGITYVHRCQPGLVYYDDCKCCNYPWRPPELTTTTLSRVPPPPWGPPELTTTTLSRILPPPGSPWIQTRGTTLPLFLSAFPNKHLSWHFCYCVCVS